MYSLEEIDIINNFNNKPHNKFKNQINKIEEKKSLVSYINQYSFYEYRNYKLQENLKLSSKNLKNINNLFGNSYNSGLLNFETCLNKRDLFDNSEIFAGKCTPENYDSKNNLIFNDKIFISDNKNNLSTNITIENTPLKTNKCLTYNYGSIENISLRKGENTEKLMTSSDNNIPDLNDQMMNNIQIFNSFQKKFELNDELINISPFRNINFKGYQQENHILNERMNPDKNLLSHSKKDKISTNPFNYNNFKNIKNFQEEDFLKEKLKEIKSKKSLKGLTSLYINREYSKMIVNSTANSIYIYDPLFYDESPTVELKGLKTSYYVKSVLSPNCEYVISGSSDACIYIWDIKKTKYTRYNYQNEYLDINPISFSGHHVSEVIFFKIIIII